MGATQLVAFLRHWFCTNFVAVKARADFDTLDAEHRAYIEENQWPPKSYFASVDAYHKEHKAWEKRTKKGAADGGGGGVFSKLSKFLAGK